MSISAPDAASKSSPRHHNWSLIKTLNFTGSGPAAWPDQTQVEPSAHTNGWPWSQLSPWPSPRMVKVLPNPTSNFALIVVVGFSAAVLLRRGARRAGVAHWVGEFRSAFPVVATARLRNPVPPTSLAFSKDPFSNRCVFISLAFICRLWSHRVKLPLMTTKFFSQSSAYRCVNQPRFGYISVTTLT